ncbi:hypothetical protein POM88_034306 [Heracleum sosnowskyi]|uniref:Uncharacterized protein n=1 Tax=Heracleum sosnowskyi TaxID=360622 RepID=A0AAD8HJC9_9APIA|nr:hypothetical protein POM88_034306 [Heracleum sosnowskyi]
MTRKVSATCGLVMSHLGATFSWRGILGDAIAVNSKKASIEVIILDDGEDEDVVELTAALEELTRDEEKASAANGVTTDTLRKTEKRTREKNSIDKPRRLEKPLVSHLALWETLRPKSKIMIRLRDFLSLHET